ncbi:histidine kinase [Schistosoma japonicum]|uniref:Histidine kinase n=1 Tax=Schistosoma japonicum TaxID=6182 RepID=A0A4Z2DTV7_SCHJA|nr:histidine kinase [Schistosoma japonicum]
MDEVSSTQPTDSIHNDVIEKPIIKVPVLCIYVSEKKIMEYTLVKKYTTIGRDPNCDIYIKSSILSRKHAIFELDENYICTVTDLGSLNGTKRNDLYLKPKISYELRDGDYLYFGEIYCTLKICHSPTSTLSSLSCLLNPSTEGVTSLKSPLQGTSQDATYHLHSPAENYQLSIRSDHNDNGNDDGSDCSVLSERLLAEIVVNTGEVSHDLLPNPNHFISYSPSLSNSTDPDIKKNELINDEDGSDPAQNIFENPLVDNCESDILHTADDIHLKYKSNQISVIKNCITAASSHIVDATPLESPNKSVQNYRSSNGTNSTIPIILLNDAASTPLTCSRTNIVLVRDSDPSSIVQLRDNHHGSAVRSSTCSSIDESVFIIEESDLVTNTTAKSIDETNDLKNVSNPQKSVVDLCNSIECIPNFKHESAAGNIGHVSVLSNNSVEVGDIDRCSSRKSRTFNGVCQEIEENSIQVESTPVSSINIKNQQSKLLDVSHHDIISKNVTVKLQPLDNLQIFNSSINYRKDHSITSNTTTFNENIDSSTGANEPNSSEQEVDVILSQEWGSGVTHDLISSKQVQYDDHASRSVIRNMKPSQITSPVSGPLDTGSKIVTMKQTIHDLEAKDSITSEQFVDSPHHSGRLLRSSALKLSKSIPQSDVLPKYDLPKENTDNLPEKTNNHVQFSQEWGSDVNQEFDLKQLFNASKSANYPDKNLCTIVELSDNNTPISINTLLKQKPDSEMLKLSETAQTDVIKIPRPLPTLEDNDDCKLQRYIERSSLLRLTRLTRNQRAERVTSCILPASLGTVKFRSRQNKKSRSIHLDSSNSDVEQQQDWESSWPLVRHSGTDVVRSEMKTNVKKVASNPNHRSRGRGLRAPRIPSPLHLSGSILSEEPSQLLDEKLGQMRNDESNDPLLKSTSNNGERLSLPSFSDLTPNRWMLRSVSNERGSVNNNSSVKDDISISLKKSIRRSTRLSMRSDKVSTAALSLQQHLKLIVSTPEEDTCNRAVINFSPGNINGRHKRRITMSSTEKNGKIPKISNSDLNNTSSTSTGSSKTSRTNVIHLTFSGVDSSGYANTLRKLNAVETDDPILADYLITVQIKRTLKVLYSRARGIPIISVEWLKACKQSRKHSYPDPLNFKLHYYNIQRMHNSVVAPSGKSSRRLSSIVKLSENEQQEVDEFLSGWSFWSTPSVVPSSSDLQKLAEFAGGCWISDNDLINISSNCNSPMKSIIITTKNEYDTMLMDLKPSRKTSRLSENLKACKQCSPILCALSSLVKVSTDWFLQTIMNRKPPVWPIDPQYQ